MVRVTSMINRGSGDFDKVAVVVSFAVRGVEHGGLIFSSLRIVYLGHLEFLRGKAPTNPEIKKIMKLWGCVEDI